MRISDWSSDVCSSDLSAFDRHDISIAMLASLVQSIEKSIEIYNLMERDRRLGGLPAVIRQRIALATHGKPVDRKSVVEGKSVSVRVDLGGRRSIKKKRYKHKRKHKENKQQQKK